MSLDSPTRPNSLNSLHQSTNGLDHSKLILGKPHGNNILINRRLDVKKQNTALCQVRSLIQVPLSPKCAADVELIASGVYSPLIGFMRQADYRCVVKEMRLSNGVVWPLPITLAIDSNLADQIEEGSDVALVQGGHILAILERVEMFEYEKNKEAVHVFGTNDPSHPGVASLFDQGEILLGGDIWLLNDPQPNQFSEMKYSPRDTRRKFAERGWKKIVGFQTRNPMHRAHEFIQKESLRHADGLLFHPLVGPTRSGDIPAPDRLKSYKIGIKHYFPKGKVLLSVFPAAMRFAGPREALFHAICRKNYGCTHFIVGRDHAGVGNFYAPDAAHNIFKKFDPQEIGIEILCFEPYYCPKCRDIVTTNICPHEAQSLDVSGTSIRQMLRRGELPPRRMMRPEVSKFLIKSIRKEENHLFSWFRWLFRKPSRQDAIRVYKRHLKNFSVIIISILIQFWLIVSTVKNPGFQLRKVLGPALLTIYNAVWMEKSLKKRFYWPRFYKIITLAGALEIAVILIGHILGKYWPSIQRRQKNFFGQRLSRS